MFSYQKEIEFEGEIHNVVLVVENFLGTARTAAAMDVVGDLMDGADGQFEHIVGHCNCPLLFDEFGLDEAGRAR